MTALLLRLRGIIRKIVAVIVGVSEYAELDTYEPKTVADFVNEYYRSGGNDTTFTNLFTFSRASIATYFDANGDLQTATSGTPRVGHHVYNGTSWVNQGILLEPQRVNHFDDNTSLATQFFQNNVTSQTAIGPDGTSNALKIIPNAGGGLKYINWTEGGALGAGVGSCFVKADGFSYIRLVVNSTFLYFDLATGTVYDEPNSGPHFVEKLNNGWYRIGVADPTKRANIYLEIYQDENNTIADGDGSSGVLVFGFQSEFGSTMTSYIPTSGSNTTRAADSLTIAGTDLTYDSTNMSFAMDGTITYADEDTAAQHTFFEWVADASNYISMDLDTDSTDTGEVNGNQSAAGTLDTVVSTANYTAGVNSPFNIAMRNTSGAINIAKDGASETADTTPTALPNLSSASFVIGADDIAMTVKTFRQWDDDITDAGIESASLLDYAVVNNAYVPETVADFANEYYRSGGSDTTFANLFTFSRASIATYFDENGDLQTAASGEARFNHVYDPITDNWISQGILLERQGFNGVNNSENFGQWSRTDGTIRTFTTAPFNSSGSAIKIAATTANARHFVSFSDGGFSSSRTHSIWIKADGLNYVIVGAAGGAGDMLVDLTTGEIKGTRGNLKNYSVQNFGDGWYRCSVSNDVSTTADNGMSIVLSDRDGYDPPTLYGAPTFAGNDVDGILVYGPMSEQNVYDLSSYIPTTDNANITRAADSLTIAGTDLVYDSTNMSFAMDGTINYADGNTSPQHTFFEWVADASNYISMDLDTDGAETGEINGNQSAAGTLDSIASTTRYIPGADVSFNIAMRNTSSAINIAKDGAAETEDTTPTALPDLSSATLTFAADDTVMVLKKFRQWGNDVTDAGIIDATDEAPFTPARLFSNGEQGAWYDPSDLSTMWTDTAGTIQATVGDPVARIDDKSGNGNHATQATVAARPILRQSGGLYYLDFDGSDDFIECSGLSISISESSIFIGSTGDSRTGGYYHAMMGTRTTNGGLHSIVERQGDNIGLRSYFRDTTLAVTDLQDTTSVINNPSVNGSICNGSTLIIRHNGSITAGTSLASAILPVTVDDIAIGASRYNNNTIASDIDFYGGVFINRELTASEISDTEPYIAGKTGVTL